MKCLSARDMFVAGGSDRIPLFRVKGTARSDLNDLIVPEVFEVNTTT